MKRLQSIIAFLCMNYPHKSEITKARLTKMVYLADWFSAVLDSKQLTEIEWVFNHYGPYVDDVVETAISTPGFKTEPQFTAYGSPKLVISYNGTEENIQLDKRDKDILSAVIEKTNIMNFNNFLEYVYSTYPVKTKERYSTFDLVSLARKYKEEQANSV